MKPTKPNATYYMTPLRRPALMHLLGLALLLALAACGGDKSPDSAIAPTEKHNPLIQTTISNHKVSAMAEDRHGYIWIGTFRGLNRYNGHTYQQYFCNDDSLGLPDNQVTDLLCDRRGRLWVATIGGVCRYTELDNFERIAMDTDNKNCRRIIEAPDGRILLLSQSGLLVYDEGHHRFVRRIKLNEADMQRTSSCFVDLRHNLWIADGARLTEYDGRSLRQKSALPLHDRRSLIYSQPYLDHGRHLWIPDSVGISIYDVAHRRREPLPAALASSDLTRSRVQSVRRYNGTQLIFFAETGIYLYDQRTGRLHTQADSRFPFKIPPFKAVDMFADSHGNHWIWSNDEGYTVRYNGTERFCNNSYLRDFVGHQPVFSVATDGRRSLWLVTKHQGLILYRLDTRTAEHVKVPGTEQTDLYDVFVSADGHLWLGTHTGTVECSYDGSSLHVLRTHSSPLVLGFAQDSRGTVWASGNMDYIIGFHPDGRVEEHPAFPTAYTFVPSMLPLRDGRIVLAGYSKPLKSLSPATGTLAELLVDRTDWARCISRSRFIPTQMMQDSRDTVWISTVSNGVLRYSPASSRIDRVQGISCSDASSLIEDRQHNVWVSTMYGLNKVDRRTGKVRQFFEADGIGGNQFYDRASALLPDGTLVFGGTHGITIFNPVEMKQARRIPLTFENLWVHGDLVHPDAGRYIDRSLTHRPVIDLSYRDNSFRLSFAALDYAEYERVHYYYKLEGFDEQWTDALTGHEASYANLPAGRYTFRVKIARSDEGRAMAENSIEIHVGAAPWNTWWAWLCYISIIAAVVGYRRRVHERIAREKAEKRQAQTEKEQEQRVNRMNMSFFANISHEFRTPLTMISGPVAQLSESPTLSEADRRLLVIVQRSVARMLKLVNQLMDFNKLENDTLRLQVRRTDVIAQLQHICDMFAYGAREKDITLTTHGLEDSFLMWLDTDKLDKIVSNLLSNALKFTPRGGEVTLSADVVEAAEAEREFAPHTRFAATRAYRYLKLVVADTGKGIPEAELDNVFRRYYQIHHQTQGIISWGTGIGLYFARRLAELHHGYIRAANRREGHGAVFTVVLPVGEEAYSESEHATLDEEQAQLRPAAQPYPVAATATPGGDDERPLIMVVDDDAEVVDYLQTLLAPTYKVMYRFDARSALRAMETEAPALVLSDVIMPDMDGYALCRHIKDDAQLCHIPVVLLTAKSTVDNQVEGLEAGADAYVVKPFVPQVLMAQIHSLLVNRSKAQQLLSSSTHADEDVEKVLAPQDQAFIKELYRIMEQELSNPELDVARLTELMHISRTKLYYKLKGLTGEKPNSFFRTYKLNRAAELLKEGVHTVSEISDMTGFSSLSYFSTSFKKQFGVSPSEYTGE